MLQKGYIFGFINEYVHFCHVVKLYKGILWLNKAGLSVFMSSKMTEIHNYSALSFLYEIQVSA